MGILERFKIVHIVAALGIVAVAAVAFVASGSVKRELGELHTIQLKIAGYDPVLKIADLVRNTQMSRGVGAGYLAGNQSLRSPLSERHAKLEQALAIARESLASAAAPAALQAVLADYERSWRELGPRLIDKRLSGADSFSQHTRLVGSLMELVDSMMDHYSLSLEPVLEDYQLAQTVLVQLPWLTEHLGQMRGFGNALLTNTRADERDRQRLRQMWANADARLGQARRSLGKVVQGGDAELATALKSSIASGFAQVAKGISLSSREILEAEALTYDAKAYFAGMTESIDAAFKLIADGAAALDRRLRMKEQSARSALFMVSVVSMLFAAFIGIAAWMIGRAITRPLASAVDVATAIAAGDLSKHVSAVGSPEFRQLLGAVESMRGSLVGIVSEVRERAMMVANSSKEVLDASNGLARRVESDASATAETAAAVEQMTVTGVKSAEFIDEVATQAVMASDIATRTREEVVGLERIMADINQSSVKIGNIISVIDGIAFQTNILALNAAVEAARAGDAGRGFSVVASEVRALAQRAAGAAKEITGLITESSAQVHAGTDQMNRAGGSVGELVELMAGVSERIRVVSESSQEQRAGLDQINTSVVSIDESASHNAAQVEETAATVALLQEGADQLMATVSAFKV
ncbi:MAG: methyl-accepting chemotaxis protein [Burkholderiaceae bacterium]